MSSRCAIATMLLFAATHPVTAQEKTGFINKAYKGPEGDSKYVVFIPHDYKGDKDYPTILFLHGLGQSGTDGVKQAGGGLGKAIRANEKKFGFIAVFPQSHNKTWSAKSPDGKRAMSILGEVEKTYKVDTKRVYLTGLSMGGFGTFSLTAAHPKRFAAVAPICGGGDPGSAMSFKDVPLWCFHGDADSVVKVDRSRSMIAALKKAGGDPKYTEYPGVDHNSWDRAYATAELYEWFLKHKLP